MSSYLYVLLSVKKSKYSDLEVFEGDVVESSEYAEQAWGIMDTLDLDSYDEVTYFVVSGATPEVISDLIDNFIEQEEMRDSRDERGCDVEFIFDYSKFVRWDEFSRNRLDEIFT